MSEKKSPTSNITAPGLFGKENYVWIVAGLAVIALGLIMFSTPKKFTALPGSPLRQS